MEDIKESNGVPQEPIKEKKKLGFFPGLIVGFIAAMLLITSIALILVTGYMKGTLALPGTETTVQVDPSSIPDNSQELDLNKINAKMKLLQTIISKNFLFEENMEDVQDGIYSGLMSGLGDPYSVYYNEEAFADLNEETSGVYCGIGAQVSQNINTGIVTAVKVFENSPAAEAGMESGDILYKVGDTSITGMDLDLLVNSYIRGEEGTTVDITVLRGDDNTELTYTVSRRPVEVPTVEHKMLDNNIGYISVTQFDTPTTAQFDGAIDDLIASGAKSLIIDMRDNPGGLLSTAVNMLDYVLPDGLVVYTADKNGNGEKYYSEDGHQVDMPMVILVNGNSASAAEVFTGAMKDFNWATVVGTQTFGKGIVQNVFPLGDGTAMKVTVEHYYTPSGFDLHGKGITPDKVVELPKDAAYMSDEDTQLQSAIDTLSK